MEECANEYCSEREGLQEIDGLMLCFEHYEDYAVFMQGRS